MQFSCCTNSGISMVLSTYKGFFFKHFFQREIWKPPHKSTFLNKKVNLSETVEKKPLFVFSFGLQDFLSEFGFGLCQVLFVCSHFCLCFKYFFLCLIFLSVKKQFLGLGFLWREERHKYSNMSEDKSNLKCKNRWECVHITL